MDNKIFWSVFSALIAFAVLCSAGYLVYQDNEYHNRVKACINHQNKKIIQSGEYDLLTSEKTEITKECREAVQL